MMKELIEKYRKRIELLEKTRSYGAMGHIDFIAQREIKVLKETIQDLESLQSKGKTKEEVLNEVFLFNEPPIYPDKEWYPLMLKAMEEYAQSHANKDGFPWIKFDSDLIETYPKKYDKYLICRKDGKIHWETWNGSGWAYNHNEIRHYAQIITPQR